MKTLAQVLETLEVGKAVNVTVGEENIVINTMPSDSKVRIPNSFAIPSSYFVEALDMPFEDAIMYLSAALRNGKLSKVANYCSTKYHNKVYYFTLEDFPQEDTIIVPFDGNIGLGIVVTERPNFFDGDPVVGDVIDTDERRVLDKNFYKIFQTKEGESFTVDAAFESILRKIMLEQAGDTGAMDYYSIYSNHFAVCFLKFTNPVEYVQFARYSAISKYRTGVPRDTDQFVIKATKVEERFNL